LSVPESKGMQRVCWFRYHRIIDNKQNFGLVRMGNRLKVNHQVPILNSAIICCKDNELHATNQPKYQAA